MTDENSRGIYFLLCEAHLDFLCSTGKCPTHLRLNEDAHQKLLQEVAGMVDGDLHKVKMFSGCFVEVLEMQEPFRFVRVNQND